MTNLLQSLENATTTSAPQDVDYVAWATEKFRTEDGTLDVAALAKGKYESDVNFIPRLTTELQDARKEAATRASLADFMDKWEQTRSVNTNTQVTPPGESQTQMSNQNTLTAADIERLAEEKWNKKNQEAIAKSNIDKVTKTLTDKWGSGARGKLEEKAKSLNVGLDFLQSIAMRSPEAFLEIVLDKAPAAPPVAPGTFVPPKSNINSQATLNTNGSHKTRKQWNDERRKMRATEYWTPEVQNAILNDKIALGADFDK